MCPVESDMCAAAVRPIDASKRESPSTTSTCERVSAPPPPHFSGNATPRNPSSPSFLKTSRGKISFLSHSVECGLISRSAKAVSVSRMRRCSSVISKFIRIPGSAASFAGVHVRMHPFDDVFGRCTRGEDLPHAHCLQFRHVFLGNDAAAENRNVVGALLFQ